MRITVTKEFRQAFKKCMDYYGVTGDELEFEKERVRASYDQAEKCYLAAAEKIDREELTRMQTSIS